MGKRSAEYKGAEGITDKAEVGHQEGCAAGAEAEQKQCVAHASVKQTNQSQEVPIVGITVGPKPELTEEEEALLKRHDAWIEQQCLQRLPHVGCTSVYLINRARRYERLVSLHAPEIVLENEARCLAEEMVLYYCMAK